MSPNPSLDAGIPVLTEIIPSSPPVDVVPPKPAPSATSAAPAAAPAPQAETAAVDAHPAAAWDDDQWDRLEREVRERVLRQVLERIDFVLEQRVRDSLADVLQLAVEKLADDIKNGLHHSIKDVVSRAVAQEITKLQSAKK